MKKQNKYSNSDYSSILVVLSSCILVSTVILMVTFYKYFILLNIALGK